jgi:hypothetical protein
MQKLDDAAYGDISRSLRDRVVAHVPDWTDNNESDPGIVLLELFAFLTETLQYRANAIPERGGPVAARLAKFALALAPDNAGTASGAIERPRYFTGQILGVDDFQLEQDYFRERLRRHNRQLHGFGVVHGLGVSVRRKGTGQQVAVEPGFAIGPSGEEIEVPGVATIDLPAGGSRLYVTLLHTERATRPQPAIEGREPQFTRIEEGFAVRLEIETASDAVSLARLLRADGGWRVDETFKPAWVAASAT